jgi:hypothetical protein
MGRRFIPIVVVAALAAFAVAAGAAALAPWRGQLWRAAVALIVLGGITPLIYAVNVRIVPVFARRTWRRPKLLYAGIGAALAGAWLVFVARYQFWERVETLGMALALAGGLLFSASLVLLFRSPPATAAAPPLPYPGQAAVDRLATNFMRLAGAWLLFGLSVGLLLTLWTPGSGRWDLVWAHALLVGWFVSMASGVTYHVLTRWTTHRWRWPRLIGAHLLVTLVALPAMVLALATDQDGLFKLAGPLQALAVLLWLANVVPIARQMPRESRAGVVVASGFLAFGVLLGASAAMDPVNHTRLRISHAEINLFGFAGLLVCGVGYYLLPRFAGHPLRWPRLAPAQISVHALAVVVSAVSWWWRLRFGTDLRLLILVSGLTISASFATFAVVMAATFRSGLRAAAAPLRLQPARRPVPRVQRE